MGCRDARDPKVLGIGPRVLGIGPRVLGIGPRVLGIGPRVLGLTPSRVGMGVFIDCGGLAFRRLAFATPLGSHPRTWSGRGGV